MNTILQKSKSQLQQEIISLLGRIDQRTENAAQTIKQPENQRGKSKKIEQINLLKRIRFKAQNLQVAVKETSESGWETLGKQFVKDFKDIEQDWVDIDSIR